MTTATTNTAAVRQLSDGNSQGTVLGQSSTDLIGFYNVTPIVRPAMTGSISSNAVVSTIVKLLNDLGLATSSGTAA